ncbi:MAG: methyltransferase domain-containing protein [Deltaproteobacteria bacterium]|nr:methyltransferase domain-containing protein [Deltaproteobacteria bacterium]
MSCQKRRTRYQSGLEASSAAYWMIRLIHDNPILPLVRKPYKILDAAGLKKGQTVFEIGCGPGFFTIPAAKIVGDQGYVYACDIQPRFVARVKEKMEKEALRNITPMYVNASNTGLPDKSVDLAFIFGLRYIAGGLDNVILEICRILKDQGVLSFEKTGGSAEEMIEEVEDGGFVYTGKQGRIFLFKKKGA